ncbi:FxSxx-COOH system tetratricopeptide repeat protein [Streptomyces sp. NPDC060232]|uniref:FxSxx-COOH system tetratricopeptide repeat protein n=1 Tax=Streptomyces sp. NPDC060232 TaxID=3347079 RepID=UPI0036605D4A
MQGGLAAYHIDHVTYQSAPRGGVPWPHQVGVLPRRAGAYQVRTEGLGLRDTAADAGGAVQVLVGMGGVGKTQLAADHARRAWAEGEIDLLVWVTAASRQAVVDAYAQASVEILGSDPTDPERAAAAFLAWLEPKPVPRPARWLVVLDDVADPGDLRGLWPPGHGLGRTLITTRRRDAALAGRGRHVQVGLFGPDQALAYLQQALAAYGRSDDAADLSALAGDLGCLPLALSQAAAYLGDTGLDAAGYRTRLADRARQVADLLPESEALPDDQASTAAAAWSLSLEHADRLRPVGLARPMLHLTAVLDPNGIPQRVLTGAAALAHLRSHRTGRPDDGPARTPLTVSAEDATGALRALHRLNLIDHTPEEPHRSVRVHQVVQRATLDTLDSDRRDRLAHTAANALTGAWPEIERDTGLARTLRANAASLVACAEDALHRPDAHGVLYRLGESLGRAGQVSAAVRHFRHLTDTVTQHWGPHHPDALKARSGLGTWRGEEGDPAGAAAAFADLLEDCSRVLGPDHPHTLTTRAGLAIWQGRAGDPAAAARAFADLLVDHLRLLGPDHPATLTTRSELAAWRGGTGHEDASVTGYEELLADCLRVLGPDHPETLNTRSNLALRQGEAGDAEAAAASYAALLEDHTRVLGPDHPHTLNTRSNLAAWEGRAGRAGGAADAFADLLEDYLRVLGPDHPRTLGTRNNLAFWQGEAGDAATAAAEYTVLLADYLRVLGPDHPETLGARSDLARWQGEAGDPAGAAAAYAALLEDCLRVLGPDHPATLTARSECARRQDRSSR